MTTRADANKLIELRTQIASVTEASESQVGQELMAAFESKLPVVQKYCRVHLGSSEQADEATRETMRRALRQLPQFDGQGSLTDWVVRLARVVCQEQSPAPPFEAYQADGVVGTARSREVLEHMSNRERAALVTRAAERVGEQAHQFAYLRYQRGMEVDQAAELLDLGEPEAWLASVLVEINRAVDEMVAALEQTTVATRSYA